MAVCSEIHTKHINTLCGQNVELLNVKLAVHIVTTDSSVTYHLWKLPVSSVNSSHHKTLATTLPAPYSTHHFSFISWYCPIFSIHSLPKYSVSIPTSYQCCLPPTATDPLPSLSSPCSCSINFSMTSHCPAHVPAVYCTLWRHTQASEQLLVSLPWFIVVYSCVRCMLHSQSIIPSSIRSPQLLSVQSFPCPLMSKPSSPKPLSAYP